MIYYMTKEKGPSIAKPKLDEQKLLSLLSVTFNRHWTSGKVPEEMIEPYRRRDFFALRGEIGSKHITLITGPRQVGKTSIMFQLIDEIIGRGVEPKRILYVELDDTSLKNVTDDIINDCIEVYTRYVLKEPLAKMSDTVYIFLDEIQHMKGWSHAMKSLYDKKYRIKFFVSGSSSTEIYEASNPLQGRMSKRVISTMKFSDFACFYMRNHRPEILNISIDLRNSMRRSIESGDAKQLYKDIMENMTRTSLIEEELKIRFSEYLIRGGYPGLLRISTYSQASRMLKDKMEMTILDLVKRYKIRNTQYIEKILYLLSDVTSKNMNYSSLSQNLGIDKVTVTEYIGYLEKAYLISLSRFFSVSGMKSMRKDYKIHINDIGLRNAIVSSLNETLLNNRTEMGKVLETCIFNHAQRLQFFLSDHDKVDVGYTETKEGEIDIIINYGKYVLPIEVKHDASGSHDKSALISFMRKQGIELSIMITEKTLKLESDVLFMPAWLFALCC